ncbi:hypothetical protein ATO6_04245 [Oceanicola sp. 22II-s10i]|nr:hypothetical protein ATO6_04245 [Oceanicola sp. 22II-s10i]
MLLWLLVTVNHWGGATWAIQAAGILFPFLIAVQALKVRKGRLMFVAVGLALIVLAIATRDDWIMQVRAAFERSAFIMAYFAALATLQHAADTSPSIARCGLFLAHQPPGRRYLALTAGAHMFAVPLNYGAIALLGSLSTASAADEPDEVVRNHRVRRMLLAIQRGFSGMLTWSPLAFAVVIATVLLPDLVWARAVPYALITSGLMIGIGWALDTIFKPRIPGRPTMVATSDYGTWATILPLLSLLVVLMGTAIGLHEATGMRVTSIILVIVPLIAVGWFAIQGPAGTRAGYLGQRTSKLVRDDLPGFREEFLLMGMAGFIGALGATLLTPLVQSTGLTLDRLPAWAALVALVWLVPLGGQLGMSPLLATTLMFPIIPHPEVIGVSSTAVFVALTGGWTLGAISSPFAAPTLLLARFGSVPPRHVSWRWNGAYTILSGLAISAYVSAIAIFGLA